MTRFLHIVGRTSTLLLLLSVLFSCGTPRPLSKESLADAVWTFSQTHPDGFTLDVRKMTEPREGISVAYWATQDSHGRQALDAVVSHATTHDGFVGGWLDPSDSLYYFDSVRLFPEDSLEAAVNFGKANLQKAIYKLSTGEEIILKEDIEFVSPTNLIIMYDPQVGKGPVVKLRGKGLPSVQGYGRGTGDLYVKFLVWVPHKLSRSEKEALEQMRSSNSFTPDLSREDKATFDKVKNIF